MTPLDAETIDRLVRAAQNCGMDGPRRDRLLAGVDPGLRAQLELYKKPADQLRSDLETLAAEPPGDDTPPPLSLWLANARYMVDRGRTREAATFAEQWVESYTRWDRRPPRWSDDLAPAKSMPETAPRALFGRVVPIALVVAGIIGVVGIALADPAGEAGAGAAKYGYLASLFLAVLGVSVGLREFLGPNRLLLLIIVIFAALTIVFTVASAVTWPPADAPETPEPSDPGSLDPLRPDGAPPGRPPAERDAIDDAFADEVDPIVPPGDAPGGFDSPTADDTDHRPPRAGRGGWLSTEAARRAAPEGFETVPPGDFMMGSPPGEVGRQPNEGPQHPVTFTRPLWVQAHEVTQAEWRALMGTSPSGFDGCDDCPVEKVSWYGAAAYANARSAYEGLPACYRLRGCTEGLGRCAGTDFAGLDCPGYRLPTEAEWEYAARAGSTGRYATGDTDAHLDALGWYAANSGSRTQPVGQKAANPWGLFDMHGNVSEWCHDAYGAYSADPATDPLGPPSGQGRVVRGGSFANSARYARSAFRNYRWPLGRVPFVGFRLVRAPRAP